jgi:radical SAM superfamily enzyme YgiQ (UPF0313 family)
MTKTKLNILSKDAIIKDELATAAAERLAADTKEKFKVLFFYPNEPMVGLPPSNMAILSACLKKAGFDVKLFDCTLYKSIKYVANADLPYHSPTQDEIRDSLGHTKKSAIKDYVQLKESNVYSDFADMVEDYKPDLIAISIVDSTIHFSYKFLDQIRGKRPPILMGGTGATFGADKILNSGYVDFVCAGEGEGALVELCERLSRNEDCTNVKNIYLKDKNGEIIKNPQRPVTDLDALPMPDFSIYDNQRFYRPFMGKVVRGMWIDWDRGCPYQCSYCAAPALLRNAREQKIGKYYRVKSEETIFREMKFLVKEYKLDFIYLSSETLLIIKLEKFKRIMKRYKEEINLPFWCQSRLDSFTEERTKLLKEAGCQSTSVGLEHGNEQMRTKLLRKMLKNDKVYEGFKVLAKYNIRPTINSMLGMPDETREHVFDTFEMNRNISKILKGNHNMNVFTFVPFSGTELRRLSIEKGYVDPDEPVSFSFYKESMLTMPSMSKKEIAGLEKTAHLYIFLPKSRYPEIKIAEQDDEEGKEMFNKLMVDMKAIKAEYDALPGSLTAGDTGAPGGLPERAAQGRDHLAKPGKDSL